MCIRKFIYLFLAFLFSHYSVKAQVGCTKDQGTIYTSQAGASGKYRLNTGFSYASSGCFYPYIMPLTVCTFVDDTTGYLASTTLECPIDKNYFIISFGLLISAIVYKKIKYLKTIV